MLKSSAALAAFLLACIGSRSSDIDLVSSEQFAGNSENSGGAEQEFSGLPGIPQDAAGPGEHAVSWISSVDPTTPILQHRTMVCGVDPSCLILKGLYGMAFTAAPKPPYFAYALYKVPLGAAESDLLTMTTHGHVGAAGENYYIGLANYTAGVWDWFGPAATAPDHVIDFTTLGYDFTSAAGNMYFVVVVPQANTFHLEDIWLDFDGKAAPTLWNVWGQAFVNVTTGVGLPFANVEFEDIGTGTLFTTVADANGNWGFNLPGGDYKFRVWANTVLYDPVAPGAIETFDVNLELIGGQFTYHGGNLTYDGNVIPMPLITTDVY
jgi:hypothetical protein